LNHILESPDHGMKFAIIENEFGEVGVDEKIIKEDSEDAIVEVMNGCVCCTVRGDLVKVLKKLKDRVKEFDGVIIETTGLADPAPVAQTFFVDEDVRSAYKLDGIITVVDAKHIVEHLKEEKPEGVENESVEQVAFADRIILNKTDLIDEATLQEVEQEIRKINKQADVLKSTYSQVHPSKLINIDAFNLERTLEMDPAFLDTEGEHQHDASVTSISFKFVGDVNINLLQKWITEMLRTKGADLFRYKGLLSVTGYSTKFLFQGVHMIFTGKFGTYYWEKDEPRENRFVFIGRNLDKEYMEEQFKACIIPRWEVIKVTSKKGPGFYANAACKFLQGVEAKEAEGDKEAVEARKPVDNLRISGLGDAIPVAIGAAQKVEADGVATIVKVHTHYPEMEETGKGCAQVFVDMKKI